MKPIIHEGAKDRLLDWLLRLRAGRRAYAAAEAVARLVRGRSARREQTQLLTRRVARLELQLALVIETLHLMCELADVDPAAAGLSSARRRLTVVKDETA